MWVDLLAPNIRPRVSLGEYLSGWPRIPKSYARQKLTIRVLIPTAFSEIRDLKSLAPSCLSPLEN
jgi:hypothetical protein